jgi:hypothetical protein
MPEMTSTNDSRPNHYTQLCALSSLPIVEFTQTVAGDKQRDQYFVSLASAVRLTSTMASPERLQNAEYAGRFVQTTRKKR